MQYLTVKLSTATRCVFSGRVASLDVRTDDGSLHVNANEESFLNLLHATEVSVLTPDGLRVFALDNAAAGWKGHCFTVLAESIRLIEPQTDGEMCLPDA